jgi:hypothetical protein
MLLSVFLSLSHSLMISLRRYTGISSCLRVSVQSKEVYVYRSLVASQGGRFTLRQSLTLVSVSDVFENVLMKIIILAAFIGMLVRFAQVLRVGLDLH